MSESNGGSRQDQQLAAVYQSIDALIAYALEKLELDPKDSDWARNQIFALFALDSYKPAELVGQGEGQSHKRGQGHSQSPDELIRDFSQAGIEAGLFGPEEAASYQDAVMGIVSQRPSVLQDEFAKVEAERGGMAAMRWFYDYCVANTYIKKAQLDRNPRFDAEGLTITINLAKPEFTSTKKAAAGNSTAGGYPQCTICHANEGFAGRDKRTLRTMPITLDGQSWFWQFSPYGYFYQHGICVNTEHTPMHVDRPTFSRLLDFVDRFPGYFLGCNAALPLIGGSVLAHDHYQGGGEILPMHRAQAWAQLSMSAYPEAMIEVVDWPGTVARVVSRSRQDIIEISDLIRQAWVGYANPDLGIVNEDETGVHSAISPSLVLTDRGYEMNIILRNNSVSEEYPQGIFHAHPEFFPIKQEPIGLIEAQGLFILPGRLVDQLQVLAQALEAGSDLPEDSHQFAMVWGELQERLRGDRDQEHIQAAIRQELASVCHRILQNTAVFKDKALTLSFLEGIGMQATAR